MGRLLARRERRGLTYGELSRQTGIPAGTLGWWSARLRRAGLAGRRAPFVEVQVAPDRSGVSQVLEVVLASGHRVQVRPGFDEETLQRLVRSLGSPC